MRRASILCGVLALCFVDVTTADELSLQAPAAAAAAPTTLWNFLGIPQGINKIRDATSNPLGNRPNAERKPPLKRIADPQNLKSENPAIKKAAEVKAAEDEAPHTLEIMPQEGQMRTVTTRGSRLAGAISQRSRVPGRAAATSLRNAIIS